MTVWTVDDLIEKLEEAREELGGDAQVRMTWQPEYPIRGTVAAVTVPANRADPYGEDEVAPGQRNDGQMVWLAAGPVPWDENGYGPSWAWNEGGEE